MGVDCGGKAFGNERARIVKLTVADFLLFHSFLLSGFLWVFLLIFYPSFGLIVGSWS